MNPPLEYNGPAYLGDAYSPFAVQDDPNRPNFEVPNIGLADPAEAIRLGDRVALRQSLDTLERELRPRRRTRRPGRIRRRRR